METLATCSPKYINTVEEIKKLENDKRQWIQACKLIHGFESREEPEASEYYQMITAKIEEVYGATWLKIIEDRFNELQLKPTESREKTDQAIKRANQARIDREAAK